MSSIPIRKVSINRSTGRLPFTAPLPVHHIIHPEDPRHSARLGLLADDSGRPVTELWRRKIRWSPNFPHVFSVGVAGEEELIVPPCPTAFTQRTLRRVLEGVVFPIILPNSDETFWVEHKETVEQHLILSSEFVQFENIVIVITAGNCVVQSSCNWRGCSTAYAQYALYHQWMASGWPPKNEPTKGDKSGESEVKRNLIIPVD